MSYLSPQEVGKRRRHAGFRPIHKGSPRGRYASSWYSNYLLSHVSPTNHGPAMAKLATTNGNTSPSSESFDNPTDLEPSCPFLPPASLNDYRANYAQSVIAYLPGWHCELRCLSSGARTMDAIGDQQCVADEMPTIGRKNRGKKRYSRHN